MSKFKLEKRLKIKQTFYNQLKLLFFLIPVLDLIFCLLPTLISTLIFFLYLFHLKNNYIHVILLKERKNIVDKKQDTFIIKKEII